MTATPANTPAGSARVTDDPAMGVHVRPSGEVDAENVLPARVTDMKAGATPDGLASVWVLPPCFERTWTLIPAPEVTTTEYSGELGSVVALTITPVLVLVLVRVWLTTRALTVPSPVIGSDTNRNWSAVPKMSAPPAVMVHVPVPGS